VTEPSPAASSAAQHALSGKCPRCGEGVLFDGWVRFAPKCRVCGLDFDSFNVGDGPAAFLILIVGAIVTVGAIWLELAVEPPYWVHVIWVPIAAALTIFGLRIGKAGLLAQEYVHRAREGRIVE
jgi:uncharacterized protein (DUF983 family)